MKATELRIGNFIEYEPYKALGFEIIQVSELPFTKDSRQKPIPITEEWLLKFGFDKVENEFNLQLKTLNILSFDFVTGLYLKSEHGAELELCDIVTVKYVHQLQNLYFALTGEELEIK